MTAFVVPDNLAFDNYTDLVTFIEDWMDRSDLSGSVESMVALCEARLRRELSPLVFETTVTATATDGVVALPSDFDALRQVTLDGVVLTEVSPESGRDYDNTGTTAKGYSLEADQMRIWPATAETVTLTYKKRLTRLSSASPTNELLSEHPDLYFFGSMMFANGYVVNDQRAALFKALWDEAVDSANRFFTRQRRKTPRYGRPQVVV